jgi:glycosyltransferase involved in cell wall biosynthesis
MDSSLNKKVLVIIPACNEQRTLGEIIAKTRDADTNLDILVIDDGSTDQTFEEARRAGASAIRLVSRMGYGVALQTGYKYASEKKYEYLVQLDGDGQHSPDYIPDLLKPLIFGESDVVLGSRFLGAATLDESSPSRQRLGFFRRLGIGLFSELTSRICGFRITDPTSGFQALNRRVIDLFVQDLFPYQFPDADMILLLHRSGMRIKEQPVIMHDRKYGKSMHSGFTSGFYVLRMLMSMLLLLIRKKTKSLPSP